MSKNDAAKPVVNVLTKLYFSKQTKHKVVFATDEGPVTAVYVGKDAFPTGVIPAHVTLAITVEDGVPSAGEVEYPAPAEDPEDTYVESLEKDKSAATA